MRLYVPSPFAVLEGAVAILGTLLLCLGMLALCLGLIPLCAIAVIVKLLTSKETYEDHD